MTPTDTPETQRANRKYIKSAMSSPMLEPELERELARRWRYHEDAQALHELTKAYLRLVVAMASRFRPYGLPLGDLIQEGNVGLMQAAARFEPEREVRFSTYAGGSAPASRITCCATGRWFAWGRPRRKKRSSST